MYCVLDIESSGGPFGQEAIIEIAAFRFDGYDIQDQLISLVHPHREIQSFVTKITGISANMVKRAPRFHEIAKRLLELTEDAIIVGHNAKFDYRMLRQEYARLGYEFERAVLDTIPVAEELIPDLPSYGLDTVCRELGIYRNERHRAEGDARATLELFKLLLEKDRAKKISILGQSVMRNDHLDDKLNDLTRGLKTNRGLFYIHDAQGTLLYLSHSLNIKDELNLLFMPEHGASEALRRQAHSVKTEPTGNWLVAQIKERQEWQHTRPALQQMPTLELLYGIYPQQKGRTTQYTVRALEKDKTLLAAPSRMAAMRAVRYHKRQFKGTQGRLLLESLETLPEQSIWIGRGRRKGEHCAFLVEDQKLQGYFYFNLNQQLDSWEKLKRNATAVQDKALFSALLRLGIFAGDFKQWQPNSED